MVSACQDILEFVSGIPYEQFEVEKMRRSATERQLEILGEAANHVSSETQSKHPEIDWPKIIALRNKLSHDYGEILAQRVWKIAAHNVPELLRILHAIDEVADSIRQSDSGEEIS